MKQEFQSVPMAGTSPTAWVSPWLLPPMSLWVSLSKQASSGTTWHMTCDNTGSTQKVGEGRSGADRSLSTRSWPPWVGGTHHLSPGLVVVRAYGYTLILWVTDMPHVCDWLPSVLVTHKCPRCQGL